MKRTLKKSSRIATIKRMDEVEMMDVRGKTLVFTDVAYRNLKKKVHVGLTALVDGRVFLAAFSVPFVAGECPEDTAIAFAKRVFPDADAYYTDYETTREGTPAYRNHPGIKTCHQLARAKLNAC